MQSSVFYTYTSEAVELKVKTFVRAERWEAAIQAASEAINNHGRTQQLMSLLQDAERGLKISKQKDYYKVLDVSRDADERTLKKAYRRLALMYAPVQYFLSSDFVLKLDNMFVAYFDPVNGTISYEKISSVLK